MNAAVMSDKLSDTINVPALIPNYENFNPSYLCITKPCTHLHPPPPTSTQLHSPPPSSFQPQPSTIHLHLAHFNLHPALCNTLNVIRTKTLSLIELFSKISAKKFKVFRFD